MDTQKPAEMPHEMPPKPGTKNAQKLEQIKTTTRKKSLKKLVRVMLIIGSLSASYYMGSRGSLNPKMAEAEILRAAVQDLTVKNKIAESKAKIAELRIKKQNAFTARMIQKARAMNHKQDLINRKIAMRGGK
jgi:hypothetical protein